MTVRFERARAIGDALGVRWSKVDIHEFRHGLEVELEHRDVTRGSLLLTAKIVLAHLRELPDYYSRLAKMERRPKSR